MGEAKRRAAAEGKAEGKGPGKGAKPAGGRKVKRRLLPARLTWKSVGLFLLTLALLDLVLYLVFEFGFGKCYGVLCLL